LPVTPLRELPLPRPSASARSNYCYLIQPETTYTQTFQRFPD
jgi:hypothetical protein